MEEEYNPLSATTYRFIELLTMKRSDDTKYPCRNPILTTNVCDFVNLRAGVQWLQTLCSRSLQLVAGRSNCRVSTSNVTSSLRLSACSTSIAAGHAMAVNHLSNFLLENLTLPLSYSNPKLLFWWFCSSYLFSMNLRSKNRK